MPNSCNTPTKGQLEAQQCLMLCGWLLHSIRTIPTDTTTYHLMWTNTAPNTQMKTTEKINLHLSHPPIHYFTTNDTDQPVTGPIATQDCSLHHNHHYSLHDAMQWLAAILQPILISPISATPIHTGHMPYYLLYALSADQYFWNEYFPPWHWHHHNWLDLLRYEVLGYLIHQWC